MTGLAILETLERSKSQRLMRMTASVTSATSTMRQLLLPLSNPVTMALVISVISIALSNSNKQSKLKTTHLLKPLETSSSPMQLNRKTVDLEVSVLLKPVFQSQLRLQRSPNRIQLITILWISEALLSLQLQKRNPARMVLVTLAISMRLQSP